MSRYYISLDTETTGLNPITNGIIEIGAVASNSKGDIVDVYQSDCRPGNVLMEGCSPPAPGAYVEATKEALDVNGFTLHRIAKARPIGHVLFEFFDWAGNFGDEQVAVLHNAPFDLAFFKVALYKEVMQEPKMFRRVRDTATLSPAYFGEDQCPRSLVEICSALEIEYTGAHRAFSDALATHYAFWSLTRRLRNYGLLPILGKWKPTQINDPNTAYGISSYPLPGDENHANGCGYFDHGPCNCNLTARCVA